MQVNPPLFPAGPYTPTNNLSAESRQKHVIEIERFPSELRTTLAILTESQLNTKYKNWTIRQIVHHLADSHVHSYMRFKWALTEDRPTIKAYEEADWADLADARNGDIEPPMLLLASLHPRWVQLMRSMSADQFARAFIHGQTGETISLDRALGYYVWHGKHHLGQIRWLIDEYTW